MNENKTNGEPRQLLGKKLLGYSSGIFAQFLLTNILNSYILVYFTKALGVDALLVSIGTALGALTNAFCAPTFGYLSDIKKPGKLGKRGSFMIGGLPILAFAFIMIWIAPGWNQTSTAMFFWIFNISFYINYAMIRASYLAMIQEQSQVEKNRVKISAIQGLFSILATIIGIIFPLIMQGLLEDPNNPTLGDMALLKTLLPIFGVIFAGLAVLFTLMAYFSVDEGFFQDQGDKMKRKSGFIKVIKDIFKPLADKEYRKWLLSSYSMNAGIRMIVKNLTFFFTVVLLLNSAMIPVFALLAIPFAFVGFVLWTARAKSKGLKKTFIQSTIIIFAFLLSTVTLLFTMPKTESASPLPVQIHAYVLIAGVLFSLVGGFILPNPIVSKLVDQAPEGLKSSSGESLSGKYFGAYSLFLNLANATGDIIVGIILAGGNENNPLMVLMVLPIASIAYLIAVIIFRTSKMDEN